MDEGYNPDEQEESQEGLSDGQMNMDQGFQEQPQNQQNRQMQQPQPQQQQSQSLQGSQQFGTVDPAVEELIETIVAEQFQRVRNEFESVYEELDMIEEELEDLDNRVHDLEIRDDEDQEEFVQKVDEMEDHIDSYQSRIGGLEKAFQQILPSLVDNVKELTSLVQEIKQEKGIETSTDVSEEDVEDIDMSDW
jgi:peptidoglycan hydrolase CwlO-like protein